MLDFLLFSTIIAFGFLVILLLNRGTFLDFKNIWSVIFYKQALLILLPVLLLSTINAKEFTSLKMVNQSDVFFISSLVLFSFFIFALFFLVLNRFFLKSKYINLSSRVFTRNSAVDYFSVAAIFSGVFLLIFSILFLGYQHAFIASILSGVNILHVRLQNAYSTNLPSQLAYLITVSYWVAAIYSSLLATEKRYINSLFFFVVGVFLSSAGGSKAPVVDLFVFFVMGYLYFSSNSLKKVSFSKILLWFPVYISVIFIVLYYVVSLQIADLTISKFLIYLLERLGVGQMAGVYETFSIDFLLPGSAWHMIPFANLFVDYPIFSKELMLLTENREFSDTGVKNSFFIAEAYGMGGWFLMIVSPVWMAFAYIIKIFILSFFLKYAFGESVRDVYLLPLFFLSTNPTGDFSSFAFQKGTLLLVFTLILIYLFLFVFKPSIKFFMRLRLAR